MNRPWCYSQTYAQTEGRTEVRKSMKSQDLPFHGSNKALQFPRNKNTQDLEKHIKTEELKI